MTPSAGTGARPETQVGAGVLPEAPSIETDPDAYLRAHALLDEEVCDGLVAAEALRFRAEVRKTVAQHVAPRAAAADRESRFVGEGYLALAEAGLVGVLFPPDLGGLGRGTVDYALAMEEIAAACPSTSLVYMTQTHAAYPIMLRGSAELAKRYIPPLLDGRAYGSMAITEPDAGSDASRLRTSASPCTDGAFQLNGSKTFITTGDRADVIVCFATTDPAAGRNGVTAFVVPGDAPGLTHGWPMHKMGMHGSSTAELFFDGTPIDAGHMLGAPGSGWDLLTHAVVKSRISAAAQGVGIARGAYAHGLVLLNQIYDRALPQQVADRMADLRGRLSQGRLLLLATARHVDAATGPPTASIAMMKQHCTDLGYATAAEIVRLLGPYGDFAELGAERYLRDAKVTQIYDGTNEIQRLLIARETAGRVGRMAQ